MVEPIERAKKIAKNLIRVKKLTNPTNIYKLIKSYATFEIEYSIPFDFDGLCFFENTKPHIILNGNIPASRQKFTLAHELGHILIPGHKNIMACYMENEKSQVNLKDKKSFYEYKQKESEANAFASELLMPEEWIKKIIIEFNSYERILNEVYSQTDLSIQAISIRVVKFMQPGIVIIVSHQNLEEPIILESKYVGLDFTDFELGYKKLLNKYKSRQTFNFNNYEVNVFDLYNDIEFKDDIELPQIKSTDIL